MKKKPLTPASPLWWGFRTRLSQALLEHDGSQCKHDLTHTVKILKSLPGIDVDETIQLFMELGGFCDCEVLMNVEYGWNE
jgi:hypothetical protein